MAFRLQRLCDRETSGSARLMAATLMYRYGSDQMRAFCALTEPHELIAKQPSYGKGTNEKAWPSLDGQAFLLPKKLIWWVV